MTVCERCGQVHLRCSAHAKHTARPDLEPGSPCRRWPVAGATVCVVHGGVSPQAKAQNKQRVALNEARKHLGVAIDVDPTDAMMSALGIAAGDLVFWSNAVNQLTKRVGQDRLQAAEEIVARFEKMAMDAGIGRSHLRLLRKEAEQVAKDLRKALPKSLSVEELHLRFRASWPPLDPELLQKVVAQ